MTHYIAAYFATALVFLGIDYIWLAKIATRFYAENLGHLMMEKPNFAAAGGFYILYIVGIVIFAISPAMRTGSLSTALVYGALFGFFAYSTYDVTNYATLRGWPILVVGVDVLWGTVLTSVSAGAGAYAAKFVSGN